MVLTKYSRAAGSVAEHAALVSYIIMRHVLSLFATLCEYQRAAKCQSRGSTSQIYINLIRGNIYVDRAHVTIPVLQLRISRYIHGFEAQLCCCYVFLHILQLPQTGSNNEHIYIFIAVPLRNLLTGKCAGEDMHASFICCFNRQRPIMRNGVTLSTKQNNAECTS